MAGLITPPVFTSACTGCGACLLTCPTHAIRPGARRAPAALTVIEALCTGCGECVEVCPADAVRLADPVRQPVVQAGGRDPRPPATWDLRRQTKEDEVCPRR